VTPPPPPGRYIYSNPIIPTFFACALLDPLHSARCTDEELENSIEKKKHNQKSLETFSAFDMYHHVSVMISSVLFCIVHHSLRWDCRGYTEFPPSWRYIVVYLRLHHQFHKELVSRNRWEYNYLTACANMQYYKMHWYANHIL